LASSTTIDAKQPGETLPVNVDFSDGVDVAGGDAIASVEINAYKWNDRDQVQQTYDLASAYPADEVEVTLRASGVQLVSETFSLASALTRLLVQADNESAWESASGIIVEGSDGFDADEAWFLITGGTAGLNYKITVKATTDDGIVLEHDIYMSVSEL